MELIGEFLTINGRCYVGSFVNLSSLFRNYFYLNCLAKRTSKYKSRVYNTLLAHEHENIQLEILEVCTRFDVFKKEQLNIYYFKPGYNILTTLESSLYFKHF